MSAVSLDQAAALLVQRARAGDQSARAQLARIGQEARNGTPRAQAVYLAVKSYIDNGGSDVGVDPPSNAIVTKTPLHITVNMKAVPVWGGIMGAGALAGGLLWGTKGALLLGVGVPAMVGLLLYSALRHMQ